MEFCKVQFSTRLFIQFSIDKIVESLEAVEHTDASIFGRRFDCLLYADDMVVFGHSVNRVQQLLNQCEEFAIKNRFQFNVKKCEVVGDFQDPPSLKIYGQNLPVSETFTYLSWMCA